MGSACAVLGAEQNVVAFLQEAVAEGERGERGHVVAQLVAQLPEVALKAEILREPGLRPRTLPLGGGPDVAAVLLAVVGMDTRIQGVREVAGHGAP